MEVLARPEHSLAPLTVYHKQAPWETCGCRQSLQRNWVRWRVTNSERFFSNRQTKRTARGIFPLQQSYLGYSGTDLFYNVGMSDIDVCVSGVSTGNNQLRFIIKTSANMRIIDASGRPIELSGEPQIYVKVINLDSCAALNALPVNSFPIYGSSTASYSTVEASSLSRAGILYPIDAASVTRASVMLYNHPSPFTTFEVSALQSVNQGLTISIRVSKNNNP